MPQVQVRLVVAIALAVLGWAGPSTADPLPEGAVTEACRAQSLPDQACDTVRALTWGVAAACRRAEGPPEACAAGNGQQVGEAQLDAYAASWVHRAHADQRALQAGLPFADATVVATHNSYNAHAYAATLSRSDANQTYAIADQLRMDVRRLELDVHWWIDPATGARVPTLCHATDEPYQASSVDTPLTRHAGCTTEFPLETGLREVAAWLDDHPGEVVMVRFETHLEAAEGYDAASATLHEVLGERLFKRPADADQCPPMPLDASVAEVRSSGAQVIAVGDCGPAGSAWSALTYRYVPLETTYRGGFAGYPDCGPDFTADDYAGGWVRYFEDATWLSSMTSPSNGPQPLTADAAREMDRCGVNQVSFDHLTPTDGRLEALVWSWAPGENDAPVGEDCAALGGDGRFTSERCTDARPFGCADGAGAFLVTTMTGPWTDGVEACVDIGSTFAVPRTSHQNELLRAAAVGAPRAAWLAYHRGEDGGWTSQGG